MSFLDYAKAISNDAKNIDIAAVAKVAPSTVTRWATTTPTPEAVSALCRHYGRPVIEGAIAAGFITQADARAHYQGRTIADHSDQELIAELTRRLARTSHPPATITSPADYGEEPTPDEYRLAAGDIARDPGPDPDSPR